MECAECGHRLGKGARSCPACGQPVYIPCCGTGCAKMVPWLPAGNGTYTIGTKPACYECFLKEVKKGANSFAVIAGLIVGGLLLLLFALGG